MWGLRPVVNRYVNPVTRLVAKRLPGFAILTHRGRKSGRTYRTPINVFRRGSDYYFFLTYGSDVEWVKNVLAAGSCSIETRGRVVDLVEPELVTDPELRPAPPHVRFIESACDSGVQPHGLVADVAHELDLLLCQVRRAAAILELGAQMLLDRGRREVPQGVPDAVHFVLLRLALTARRQG